MALSARNAITTVVGLVALAFVARKIEQKYFGAAKPRAPRLVSNPDFEPREQSPADDEHLHVSLGEFLQGKQLQVG